MNVHDDRGREIALEHPPARIVSLVPSISETLWRLGVTERLVGVTRYCTEPPEVRALPRCGGTKNPDCERIAALHPDLVFMSEEENRVEDFEELARRGLAIFVSLPKTLADVADWVRRIAVAVGCAASGEAMARGIEQAWRAVETDVARHGRRRRVFCPIWRKPWMTFNGDTYADAVLRACGADNVFADAGERYCRTTLEEVAGRRPDLVLLPDEPYPFAERDLADVMGVLPPGSPASGARLVDGQALSWYGARTPEGLRTIEAAISGGDE